MKINRVVFKNFSAIKNAMNANKVEINFSTAHNKICLLIGRNGGGKTTILSMLHPFADLGNLDVRNGNDYILEDKEGYKEIEIQNGSDIYVIKHYYSPHTGKSHSVKSYITKNGVELNTNGNVTSFKEYVKEELKIEPEYLKLIRLGSNVTNLINLSATERKNFMGKMLEDIGIYLEYYKNINTKIRQLSDIISHDENRMNRLNIIDEELSKEELNKLKNEWEDVNLTYTSYLNQIAIHKKEIDQLDDPENLRDNLHTVKRKLEKMKDVKARKIENDDLDFYKTKIDQLEKENIRLETERDSLDNTIKRMLDNLDSLEDKRRSYYVRLEQEENVSKEIDRMNDNLSKLRLRLREYEKNIGEFSSSITKDELLGFIAALRKTDEMLDAAYSVGKQPIEKIVELLKEKKNVQSYIDKHMVANDELRNSTSSTFLNELRKFYFMPGGTITFACKEECDAKRLYEQIKNLLTHMDEVEKGNVDDSFYVDMNLAYHNIRNVLVVLQDNKDLIKQLPKEIQSLFLISTIFKKFTALKKIYPEEELNDLLSQIVEVENYELTKSEYTSEEETFQKFSDLSHSEEILSDIDSVSKEIEGLRTDIQTMQESMLSDIEQLNANIKTLDNYMDIEETLEDFDTTNELYMQYERQYTSYKENVEQIDLYRKQSEELHIHMELLNQKIQDLTTSLTVYKDLKKQLKKYHKIYDEMILVKEAWSSKEGIPLHFISNYLGNVEGVTNELLSIVYGNDLYIDNFVITATEFSIPFFHNGVRLSDVKYASQGELSFLSLALSFALTAQSISTYNIMLADEIDGALDVKNRAKFIDILENQIDRIQSEQNFLITHNNMFSSYPVDIIDLSFTNDKEAYPLANFIEIKRS